jgi:hypothetical protein
VFKDGDKRLGRIRLAPAVSIAQQKLFNAGARRIRKQALPPLMLGLAHEARHKFRLRRAGGAVVGQKLLVKALERSALISGDFA